MNTRRRLRRVIFFVVPSLYVTDMHVVECSLCVWDIIDFTSEPKDTTAALRFQIIEHARLAHAGLPRIVEASR